MVARGDEGHQPLRQMGKDLISAALPRCLHGTDSKCSLAKGPLCASKTHNPSSTP